jgi:hypothetical protein
MEVIMSNTIRGILVCLVIGLLVACASTEGAVRTDEQKMRDVAREMQRLKLASGVTWERDLKESTDYWSITPGSAAILMLGLDQWFDFSGRLNSDSVATLARNLFNKLPRHATTNADIRVVGVGGIFPGDTPLLVIISQFKLREGIVEGHDIGIKLHTNSMKMRSSNNKTGAISLLSTGRQFDNNLNYLKHVIPMSDGHIVAANNLNGGKQIYDPAMSVVDKANLMDTLIKDEDPANDAQVEVIYQELLGTTDLEDSLRILAHLNYGLWQLKLGNLAAAEATWALVDALIVPGLDPSILSVINKDIPFLKTVFRALTEV